MPRNGLLTASLFELVQPLAEPTTDRAGDAGLPHQPAQYLPRPRLRGGPGRPPVLRPAEHPDQPCRGYSTRPARQCRQLRTHRAGVRILRPLLGDGLFMASGAAWRAQRRTIAPAFVPSTVPTFAKAATEALIPARRDPLDRVDAPVNLLGWLQTLTKRSHRLRPAYSNGALRSHDPGGRSQGTAVRGRAPAWRNRSGCRPWTGALCRR